MKYMGSKNRIAKHILPIILKDRKPEQWYVEPFVGGCNSIDKVKGKRIGNDSNKYLISFLKALQEGYEMDKTITRNQRDEVKKNKDLFPDEFVGWVGFGCCYNGVFFGGYAGEITTKEGNKRNYIHEAVRNIEKQIPLIKDIVFYNTEYNELEIPDNSIIYCDPPYEGTSDYKTNFNHFEFWNWCREMKKQGHTIFVSEYNAPDDFVCVWEKEVTTTLNTSKKDTEKLFTL